MAVKPLTMKSVTLKFTDDGGTPVEFNCEVQSVVIDSAPGDEQRYATLCPDSNFVTSGTPTQTIALRGVQDWQATGLATFLYEALGKEVDFTFGPYGNAAPSEAEPHFTGTFLCNARPQIGGEAGTFAELDREYPIIGAVEMVTAATP
jgi:hypothetical protein